MPISPDVVITGIGLCSPLGPDRETTWRRLVAGERGLQWIDADHRWAGGAVPWTGSADVPSVTNLAMHVAEEAWVDSRLSESDVDPLRCGVVFGTSKGELRELLDGVPTTWLNLWPSCAASRLAQRWNCQGPVIGPVAACATGLVACIRAAELIKADVCDVVLAGSADASLFPAVVNSFQRLGVLAKIGDDPATACRPFDHRRTGFLIGEGAACLILERRSSAEARHKTWYGEWLGGRWASDPSGLTRCDAQALSLTRVLSDLLRTLPEPPDYLHLHGTATRLNDVAECRAVSAALGPEVDHVSCSGAKGSLGHLLGAAGSVELALTLLALRDQVVPPTVNLTQPDPECRLDLTPGMSRHRTLRTAVKISSGFGGHLAVGAVGKGTERSSE